MSLTSTKKNKINDRQYPGTSLLLFRFLFKKIDEIARMLGYPPSPSPYSLIPLISQALGLGIPMMGSGRSPYSIISYFSRLDKNIFLNYGTGLTYQQRRTLIDEIYDMIAPYLLQDEDNYITLLISTKYRKQLYSYTADEIREVGNILKKKFKIMDNFFSKIKFKGGHFAHIAHYGYQEDLDREQSFLKEFDTQTSSFWRKNSYPIVTEMYIDNIDAHNKAIWGWYIFIPNYTKEIFKDNELRQKKLLQAGMLAKNLGAKFAGMAGLVASFSKGGIFLADSIKGIGFTTGHAFTIANIYEIAQSIAKKVSLDWKKSKIAIVGAAGSIGSGVAKLIVKNAVKEMLLVDMPFVTSQDKLFNLKNMLEAINKNNIIRLSVKVGDVKDCDLLIVATNATTSIIKSEHIKSGAIIIDDSFPKNVARDIVKERDDIILLEGGIAQFSNKHNIYVARNMPDLVDLSITKLVSCKQSYGCLCETFTLAANGHEGNYGLGDADPKLAKDIWRKCKRIGVTNAVFQNYGVAIENSRIQKVKNIIKYRNKI